MLILLSEEELKMKKPFKIAVICLALCSMSQVSHAVDELTGDTKTACEALLCLSSPKDAAKTPECHPPLNKFYSIRAKILIYAFIVF